MKSLANIITNAEIKQLTEDVYQRYGYDFSDYSIESFRRRINKVMFTFRLSSVSDLSKKIREDEQFFNDFLEDITVNVTEMFRDEEFYKELRRTIIPALSALSTIRIWHAGCSTGEEVYSLAILLKEEGVLEKSILYATDINQKVLARASSAKFHMDLMEGYEENYKKSGGLKALSDYYHAEDLTAQFNHELREKMVFMTHNLVIDSSFNEFDLILCRNVLIYFNRDLQNKVIRLFRDSLSKPGFLALGTKESIEFSSTHKSFERVDRVHRIWRLKKSENLS